MEKEPTRSEHWKETLDLTEEEEDEDEQQEEEGEHINMEGLNKNQLEEFTSDSDDFHVEQPRVGITFANVEEMFSYYKKYGKQEGFPVIRRTSRKGDNGELRYVTFTCGRAGKFRSSSKNRLKPRPSAKSNCKARLLACLDEGKWRISSIHLKHNHELSPSKARFFKCYREINRHTKRRLWTNDMAGIRQNKNFNSLVAEAGGHENVSFLEKDCRNYINNMRRLQLAEGDAVAVQKYFLKMQAESSDFFYSIDLDEEGRLRNVFWADSRSRAAYKEYNRVVTFDTTYLVNKYDMPFAPFVGVNHHGQSTLLGCGLISSENTETFTWLFETWLACMSGVAPKGIITDQDKAMKNAIEIVLPNTRHRWCLWHIMKKFHEKLGGYKQYDQISYSLQGAIYDSQIPEEFEKSWIVTIEKFGLKENAWLDGLYSERHRWVPCFVKDFFWAGMSTTQRSESINAFFDGYVNPKTTLKQFVEQYENALGSKVEKEKQEDSNSANKQIPCVTMYRMEKQAQEVYTISKFREFQEELIGKMYCELLSSKVEGTTSSYEIQEDVVVGEGTKRMIFKVSYDRDDCEVKCSCKRFEFRGILCRHALAILIRNDVLQLPNRYILTQWRKDVRRCHTRVKVSYNKVSSSIEHRRFEKMCAAFTELADLAADSEESSKHVLNWIGDLKNEILQNGSNLQKANSIQRKENSKILDPLVTKRKGRPPSKRKESNICKKQKKKKKNVSTQEGVAVINMKTQTLNGGVGFDASTNSFSKGGSSSHRPTTCNGIEDTISQAHSFSQNTPSFTPHPELSNKNTDQGVTQSIQNAYHTPIQACFSPNMLPPNPHMTSSITNIASSARVASDTSYPPVQFFPNMMPFVPHVMPLKGDTVNANSVFGGSRAHVPAIYDYGSSIQEFAQSNTANSYQKVWDASEQELFDYSGSMHFKNRLYKN